MSSDEEEARQQVRMFLDGLYKRPVAGSGPSPTREPEPVAEGGARSDLQEAMRGQGQVRVQTRDDFVVVTISSKSGDSSSIRIYGPFVSADAERDFICHVWELAPIDPKLREGAIAQTKRWRRFDER